MLTNEGNSVFYLESKIGQRLEELLLVYVIKCHTTSAILATEVLLCPSRKNLQKFFGETRGKKSLEKPSSRCESNIMVNSQVEGYLRLDGTVIIR